MRAMRLALAAGACVSVGALLGPTLATGAAEKIEEVIVRNDATDPVAVDVGNSPTVTVGNSPSVNVANTPSVRVDNVPTVAEAGTPVQFVATFAFSGTPSEFSSSYEVPAGKRLRIDQVTFHDGNRDAAVERLSISIMGVSHHIATRSQGAEGDVATEPVTFYAEPDTSVHFFLELDQTLGNSEGLTHFMRATFSGVLLEA